MPDVPPDDGLRGPNPSVPGDPQPDPIARGPEGEGAIAGGGSDLLKGNGREAATAKGPRHRARPTATRRWTKRALITVGVVVVLVIALGVSADVYVNYRFGQIKKVHVDHLKAVSAKPGAPFTVLVAGSDSRTFVSTTSQCQSFGCGSETGGQRSDVIILVHVVPALHKIEMLSIPRDTWVTIPGNVEYISGQNRINAAFNDGPSLLVQTIEQDFHIPINYFVEVNFPGLENMVNAIGGIHLDFKYPVKDLVSGLRIPTAGCQLVHGVQALALVRSRHLEYEVDGVWYDDYGSDFTRIRNQQAFFRAVIHQLNSQITNPFALNAFIGDAVHNLVIDQTMSEGRLKSLALEFHNFPPGSLQAVTMPTVGPYITSGGAEVLLPAAAADEVVIQHFLDFGMPVKKATATSQATSTTTTTTSLPTVTTVAPPPSGETPIYNNSSQPYDPKPC